MGQLIADGALRRVADVVDAGTQAPPVPGRLPASVLSSLAALVPCDAVAFADLDPERAAHYANDEASDGVVRYLPEPTFDDPDDPFWRHYGLSRFCSYPTRTGDDTSVVMSSDFYSNREWKATPMYVEVFAEWNVSFELMCSLPSVGSRSRRVLFFRSGVRNFTDDDRFALALLRPHLTEMVGRRRAGTSAPALTDRQVELLRLVADGRTNTEIAATLHVSPHTVRTHLTNIFERLGVSNRAAAVARVFST